MPEADDEALVSALLAVSRTMVALTARTLADLDVDVTVPQYRALVILATEPRRSSELAEELGVAVSTMTRMCDRLCHKGLIHRFHRDGNRRTIWLGLTDAGRDTVGAVMHARRRELRGIVQEAGLTASRRTLDLLHRFVRAGGELPDDEWWQHWQRSADEAPAPARRRRPINTARDDRRAATPVR
ncbi:MarR family winged helix-turn-helix transcriptional regulator [Dactylosporangium sp. CA-139066]|uniref:MarR family winged helix-turn-helix transcriptional regulator n=1 Tax=Dactylosporangium sp. CA-139066 TaxID=3239930 RepID=UPI003D9416FF